MPFLNQSDNSTTGRSQTVDGTIPFASGGRTMRYGLPGIASEIHYSCTAPPRSEQQRFKTAFDPKPQALPKAILTDYCLAATEQRRGKAEDGFNGGSVSQEELIERLETERAAEKDKERAAIFTPLKEAK
jgi:hypothetical protein